MSDRCVSPEDVGRVLELPENDLRRVHLHECPRCRSLATAFQDFLAAPSPLPEGARAKEAHKVLEAGLRETIYGAATARGARAGSDAAAGRPPTPRRRPAGRGAWTPRLAWSLATLLVVVGAGAVWVLLPRGGVTPLVLRNEPSRTQADAGFVLSPPQTEGVGRWRLSWTPVEGADSYQVRFFSSDLDDLAQIEPVPVLSITVTRDQLGADRASGNVVLWRVAALHGGDVIANSPVGTIPLTPSSPQP